MATAIAARHVCRQWGHGITGHCRPACAESRPRRRQRLADLEPCSTLVFDGLPAQTIWIKLFFKFKIPCAARGGRDG